MSILADVAPYSREYHTFRQKVGSRAQGNTEFEIEYEKNLTRVKKTRESVIKMNDRHFTGTADEISGTVDEVSAGGITLNEFPGRRFLFSSVSTSAADMSARILGENNKMTWVLRPAEPKESHPRAKPKPDPWAACSCPAPSRPLQGRQARMDSPRWQEFEVAARRMACSAVCQQKAPKTRPLCLCQQTRQAP
jgi:hypothetical protein